MTRSAKYAIGVSCIVILLHLAAVNFETIWRWISFGAAVGAMAGSLVGCVLAYADKCHDTEAKNFQSATIARSLMACIIITVATILSLVFHENHPHIGLSIVAGIAFCLTTGTIACFGRRPNSLYWSDAYPLMQAEQKKMLLWFFWVGMLGGIANLCLGRGIDQAPLIAILITGYILRIVIHQRATSRT